MQCAGRVKGLGRERFALLSAPLHCRAPALSVYNVGFSEVREPAREHVAAGANNTRVASCLMRENELSRARWFINRARSVVGFFGDPGGGEETNAACGMRFLLAGRKN